MEEKSLKLTPPLTEKRIAENAEYQRQLSEKFPAPSTPFTGRDAEMARAAILIKENAQIINHYQDLLTKKDVKKRPIQKVLKRLYTENAEAHAVLGNFDLAGRIEPDKHRRKEYLAKARAVEMPDDRWCKHPKYKKIDGVRVANYLREADTHSDRHGRVVSILMCNECGFRNAFPLPDDLRRTSEIRAEAVRLTKGLSQTEATNVLRERGFMTNVN